MSIIGRLFRRKVAIQQQLETLGRCGIRPKDGIGINELLESFDREQYESDPYELLLVRLGGELEREPYPPISDDIWHLDTECIEDHGDYARVARRIQALAKGELPLMDIRDYVDVEAGEAWLAFTIGGREIKWGAKVNHDWLDTDMLDNFRQLLAERGSKRRLTYYDLRGQDCLIGCSTPAEFSDLKKLTGLKFEWLR